MQNEIDIIHLHGFIGALSPSILLAIKNTKKTKHFYVVQTMHEFHLVCPNSILFDYSTRKICEACLSHKVKYPIFIKRCDRRGRIFTLIKGVRSLIANNIIGHATLVDKIITPSNFVKEKLIQGKIIEGKIITISNPIVLREYDADEEKENIICFFGRFSKEKNLVFLIECFNSWKQKSKNDFKLLLIGSGDYEDEMRLAALRSKYKSDIIFKPFIPHKLLYTEIKKIKYYAMTSNCFENAPMGILESLAFNAVSIVPDIGGMKEMIEDIIKVGGIYKAQDMESWCDTMDSLERNYEKLLAQLKENKNNLISRYSEETYLKNVNKLYREIKQ